MGAAGRGGAWGAVWGVGVAWGGAAAAGKSVAYGIRLSKSVGGVWESPWPRDGRARPDGIDAKGGEMLARK